MTDASTAVHDDLLPLPLATELAAKYADGRYRFYWRSSAADQAPYFHWHIDLVDKGPDNREDLSGYLDTMKGLYNLEHHAWSLIRDGIFGGQAKLLRMYVNAYTYGTEGAPHQDSPHDDDVTAVCYLNAEWRPEWSGETVLFTPAGNDIERSVLPKLGRVFVFPAARLHAVRGMSRGCPHLRVVLAMKVAPAG